MKNLISTIQKELNTNSLYLNHCNTEIQILRNLHTFNDVTPILNLKAVETLKSILNELLTKKEDQAQRMSQEFEIEQERTEINENFEKANLQFVESYEGKNDNKIQIS